MPAEIESSIAAAFPPNPEPPALSLRAGAALAVYHSPSAFDPDQDGATDQYLEEHCSGLGFVDADSWLYYLPLMLRAAWHLASEPGHPLVEAVLWTLRPPDRAPPRLGRLTAPQEEVIVQVLERLAFDSESRHQPLALQVLEEYWIPGAQYR